VGAVGECLHSSTVYGTLFFLLFLLLFSFEFYLDSSARAMRMKEIEEKRGENKLQLDFEAFITQGEQALEKQKELNIQLQAVNERDAIIHTLHAELANRDEVLVSYKKVVERLKTLQWEHEESERKVRAEAAAQMTLPDSGAPLLKYKEKLLRMLFGNKTMEESAREHLESRSANEEEIQRIVAEEQQSSSRSRTKQNVMSDLLRIGGGGDATHELKIESVMRVQELGGHLARDNERTDNTGKGESPSKSQAPADKLVDSDKNEYILSKPGDSSKKTVDTRLVLDLGIVIVASAIGGLVASAARQPILLGYLLGGSFIGPGGARLIGQFIQIETLAQFGATFLLFALGVEFSISKLRKVKYIALIGGSLQLLCIILFVSLLGVFALEMHVKQAVFVGCVLSMSSTTVVVKSLMERKQIATLCGQVMLGLLIVQDLFLSIILALLNLAKVPFEKLGEEMIWLALKFALLGGIVVACMYIWPICLRLLDQSKSHDLFLLGLVALCVFLTVVSEKIIASAEVGAFLSGILISSAPGASQELTHRALRLFGPIRDMFGALFFCSIGMLINPIFLVEKAGTIMMLVIATLLVSRWRDDSACNCVHRCLIFAPLSPHSQLKSLITFVIVRLFGYSLEIAVRTGLGLSQIGEFAFVLVSEGVSVGLLSKDLYFLLLGTTAVSIFITPFILTASLAIVKYFQLEDRKAHAQGVVVD
jgi:Kef-type K+ transport system membrane component KefB